MKELFPEWGFPGECVRAIESSEEKRVSIRLQSGVPYFAVRLALLGRSAVVVLDEEKAEILADDARSLSSLFDQLKEWPIGFLPEKAPKEKNVFLEEAIHAEGVLWFLTRESLSEKTFSKTEFLDSRLDLKVGKNFNYSKLLQHLSETGYKRVDVVEEKGEFAPRGEVFDFWSPNSPEPVRALYARDVIESLHRFDPFSQRTIAFLPQTAIVPVSDKKSSEESPSGSILEFLPANTIFLLDRSKLAEDPLTVSGFPVIEIGSEGQDSSLQASSKIHLNWNFFKKELEENGRKNLKNFVCCRTMGESQRLEDILDDLHCAGQERSKSPVLPLSEGFVSSDLGIAVWSFNDLTGVRAVVRRLPKFKIGRTVDSISEIHPGDYVVHEKHGIARYKGLERVALTFQKKWSFAPPKEKISEFLVLEYKGGDRLLVPVQDFNLIQKYVGQEGRRPELHSLDGIAWERAKQRVRKEVAEMAGELLKTAATRSSTFRPASGSESENGTSNHLYQEFVNAFPYEETQDQGAAMEEILQDLNSDRLMDRLVCGDVGYGKTEIAMRAAFKTVCEGKQVSVLVPTTILAEQHFETFSERFAAFPVKIAFLSRFQTAREQKKIVEEIKNGTIDILIGTQRLIQKDIGFKNLGLIVIDEEHRFGVGQKEILKKMKLQADVLALSATPIPRTLSFSMGGIRDISVIETPPQGRLPIDTYVGLFDEKIVLQAVERELDRGGQVFYVHNRIATIEKRKGALEKMLPGVRIGMAHGQMNADALEKAMVKFLHKEWDILLSTTIIESGLDIPSVNTLIVEDSEEFGLAQLYQLRGRVGRQKQKAYCYLFFSGWSALSEDARKRLEAVQEFSALGSGMKLALRDLEIRGTGNLLGPQQHGWINVVGLETYCQLLSEEVRKLKEQRGLEIRLKAKEKKIPTQFPEVELNLSAFFPEEYVDSGGERIALYKRMVLCRTTEEAEKLKSECLDRFGPLPEQAANLFKIIDLKFQAKEIGLSSISESDQGITFAWPIAGSRVPVELGRFAEEHPNLIEILPPNEEKKGTLELEIVFKDMSETEIFEKIKNLLQISSKYVIVRNL